MTAVAVVEKAVDLLDKIKPEVAALVETIKADATSDAKTGVITTSADLYAKLLPEGLTMELAEAFHSHHSLLYPAMMQATGELSIPLMAENKDLLKTSMQLGVVGKDVIRTTFDRERTYPDQQTKGTITKMGQVSIDHQTYGTKNRGEVTKVKSYLSALALEALAGK